MCIRDRDTDGAQKILSVDMAAAGLDEAQTDVDEQAKADIHTGVQAILDAAELEPSVTGIDALDALVAETLAKITNEDMTCLLYTSRLWYASRQPPRKTWPGTALRCAEASAQIRADRLESE